MFSKLLTQLVSIMFPLVSNTEASQKQIDQSLLQAIAIGLIVMMWPILTKVQYESLPEIFSSRRIWVQIGLSMMLNWIVGPLVMLGLAWATLPDLPTYRTGVIMVGLARCIAMVLVWNQLAKGDGNYCAILVVFNSILQIVLYSPYALLFINVIGGESQSAAQVSYGSVAISVLIVCSIFHSPLSCRFSPLRST
jgi:arsenite transporter